MGRFFFRADGRQGVGSVSEKFLKDFRILLGFGAFEEGAECFHAFDHGCVDPLLGGVGNGCMGSVLEGFGLIDQSLGGIGASVE